MPDNWIDNLADKVHKQDAEQLQDEKLRLHEAQVISEKSRGLWEDLVLVVQRDVRRFEKDFPHDPKRLIEFNQFSPTCFRLSRQGHPSFSCAVEFHAEAAEIEFRFVQTSNDASAITGWSGSLVIRVDADDNVYLNQYGRSFRNLDDVSRLFLEPVFKS